MRIDYEHVHQVRTQEEFMQSQQKMFDNMRRKVDRIANWGYRLGMGFVGAGILETAVDCIYSSPVKDGVDTIVLGISGMIVACRYHQARKDEIDTSYQHILARASHTKIGF